LSTGIASANDIYIAQNAAGASSGANCANAQGVAWFNTAGNWGSGSNQIGPGTIVHLCGVFNGGAGSNMLTTQGNGSSGNPITIRFESGAVLQAPYWDGTLGAIYIQNSYITVDGGTNGLIQNTLNGSTGANCPAGACSQQQVSRGVGSACGSSTNAVVQNLAVNNLFVRIANPAVSDGGDTTAIALSASNSRITNNTIFMTVQGIGLLCSTGGSNLEIDHNTLSACNHCIGGGASGANTVIDNVRIHDNNFAGNAALWDDNNDDYHRNGIQIIADSSSCTNCTISNLQIYNNIFQGSWSTWNSGGPNQLNSPIFLDDQGSNTITGWKVFNNIFAMAPNDGGGVACSYGPCQSQNGTASSGSLLVNNTFYQGAGGGTCIRLDSQSGLTMENNIVAGCGYAYNTHNGSLTSPTIDYNLWYNTAGGPGSGWLWPGPCASGVGCSFSSWQAAGFDVHGKNGLNPLLDSNFRPQSGSPALLAGANLSNLCSSTPALCFDKAGAARPTTGNWTMGAYQVNSGTITLQPPTVPTVVALH
jgi:hypothetical protein